jgi:hypothetical protein
MMPRVSGFEMLDILRNTDGLKDVHVIMLTALGQAEDKTRADSLGADRYMVKSQVTLEDIVKTAADVLAGAPASITPGTQAAAVAAEEQAAAPAPTATIPVAAAPPVSPPATTTPTSPLPTAEPTTTPPVESPATTMPKLTIPISTPPDDTSSQTMPAPDTSQPSATDQTPQATPQTSTPTSVTDDKLVTDAVKDLVANTDDAANKAAPAETPPVAPAIAPPAPEPQAVVPATPPAPEPVTAVPPMPTSAPPLPSNSNGLTMQPVLSAAPTTIVPPTPQPPAQPQNDSVEVANKKIIQPLAPGSSPTPPDLHELLAKEGITNMDDTPHPAASPFMETSHPPGHVISPGGNQPGPANPGDPNSIAL